MPLRGACPSAYLVVWGWMLTCVRDHDGPWSHCSIKKHVQLSQKSDKKVVDSLKPCCHTSTLIALSPENTFLFIFFILVIYHVHATYRQVDWTEDNVQCSASHLLTLSFLPNTYSLKMHNCAHWKYQYFLSLFHWYSSLCFCHVFLCPWAICLTSAIKVDSWCVGSSASA